MKLMLKFNLVLLAIFLIGFALAWVVSSNVLQNNARDEVLQNARLIMESMVSSRNYTHTQVKPLLDTQIKYTFLPQSIFSFAATEQFNDLRKKFPDYGYKEATLNPTNPRDRAADWEGDVVNQFRQTAGFTELMGERETPQGRSLYLARPVQIIDAACLTCHSTADAAPKTMIDLYGSSNGFGWKMQEVIGAQIVSVPMAGPIKRANDTLKTFMLALGGIFVLTFLLLNIMLQLIVVRRVTRLSRLAAEVSLGNLEAGEFRSRSKDEIGVLTDALARMKASLVQAMKMLDE